MEFTKIYAPENTNPELLDRNQLWNTVEKVERRKDANLAREFEIAFPHELNKEQRERMLNDLCQELVKRHGVIVDAAIHAPHTKAEVMNVIITLISCLQGDKSTSKQVILLKREIGILTKKIQVRP